MRALLVFLVATSSLVGTWSDPVTASSADDHETGPLTTTEASLLWRISGNPHHSSDEYAPGGDTGYFGAFDLGFLWRKSPRLSVGFGPGFAGSSDVWRVSANAKFRLHWSDGTCLDIAPGLLVHGSCSSSDADWPGYTLQVALKRTSWMAMEVRGEWIRRIFNSSYASSPLIGTRWTDRTIYAGLRLDGKMGYLTVIVIGSIIGMIGYSVSHG